eukprot:SAG31_NODE_1339_length_8727_cov_6.433125_4_plen_59_part_00
MRSNGKGTLGCCESEQPKGGGGTVLKHCPVVSWWADDGDRSCWETVGPPSEPEGACNE